MKKINTKKSVIAALIMFTSMVNSETLLSNINSSLSGGFGGNPDSANIIQTGATPLIIGEITVNWNSLGNIAGINQIGIYENNSGIPSTNRIGTFFTNSNSTTVGEMTYQGLSYLDENSFYWVVVDITDGASASYTFNSSVFSDPGTGGADIPSDIAAAYGNNETGSWTLDGASTTPSLRIELGDDTIFKNGFEEIVIN